MGGVPLLVIAAAMGITYGWQPDGNGGVDYIVQISPDQIDDFRRSGELSSVIDPAVRGHVSRVVIKVGNEAVPRITPEQLGTQRGENASMVAQARADLESIPAPEIAGKQSAAVLMKPDVNDGPGMSLPALPSSLTDGGSGTRDNMAELSSELAARTREQIRLAAENAKAAQANDLRSANLANTRGGIGPDGNLAQSQVPPFTGNNDPVGRIRTGGPSTAPTAKRDDKWFGVNANANARATGPSTAPVNNPQFNPALVGPPDLRPTAQQRQTMTPNQAAQTPATQPLGSTPTYAHVPEDFVYPNAMTAANTNAATTGMTEYQRAQYELLLRQQQQQQRAGLATDALMSGNAPMGGARTNTGAGTGFGLPNNQTAGSIQRTTNNLANKQLGSVDPRLTAAEAALLPYGGWSFDTHGNPIDDRGQILDRYGRPVSSQQAYELTQGRVTAAADYERSLQQERNAYAARNNATRALPDTGLALDRVAQARLNPPSEPIRPTQTAPVSPSDRVQSASQTSAGEVIYRNGTATSSRHTLAAQPLFNGLLLFSIVANVYLVFWLKNLRHQFHDLVTSKRAATSDVAV